MKQINIKSSFIKLINSFNQGRNSFDPERDWKRIFIFVTLLFFTTLAFHVFFFYQIQNETIFRSDIVIEKKNTEINLQKLEESFEYFDAKKERFNAIRSNGLNTFDPSI